MNWIDLNCKLNHVTWFFNHFSMLARSFELLTLNASHWHLAFFFFVTCPFRICCRQPLPVCVEVYDMWRRHHGDRSRPQLNVIPSLLSFLLFAFKLNRRETGKEISKYLRSCPSWNLLRDDIYVIFFFFSFHNILELWKVSLQHSYTQKHDGATWNRKWFFRVMPEKNHFWFHKEPFKPGFFKEPFP